MIKKSLSITLWVFVFQLIAYFINEGGQYHLTAWYQALNKSPLHPPEIIFPIIWSTLYMMITLAGWLLWQERKNPKAKPAIIYYAIQILMNWAWAPIFFRFHWLGFSVVWAIGLLFATFMTIIKAAQNFELAASLLTPYLFWLFYLTYLCGYVWLNN